MSQSTPIPAEFKGMARQLWQRAADEDDIFGPAFNRIARPVLERVKRYPLRKTRDGAFAAFAEQWANLPHAFRLAIRMRIDKRGRSGDIVDLRLCPTRMVSLDHDVSEHWTELSLDVESICLDLPIRRDMHMSQVLASVSFHALARRFQRARDTGHEAFMADMRALVAANVNDTEKYPSGCEIRIPAPGGVWLGRVGAVTNHRGKTREQFLVRTFLDHDALDEPGADI
jgi:hypothetical protein